MNGNSTATVDPPAAPAAQPPADRVYVDLLKLTAAADRAVAGLRRETLTDGARTLVDELTAAVTASWEVLGPDRRMAATGG